MSKMNDLAAVLDSLTETAGRLKESADVLLRTAGQLRDYFSAESPPGAQAPPEAGSPPEPRPRRTARKAPPAPEAPTPAPEPRTPEPDPPAPEEKSPGDSTKTPASEALPQESPPTYTKEAVRGMLSDLAGSGHREEAKALVHKYAGGGSFSDIDPGRYPELAEEVRKIHG